MSLPPFVVLDTNVVLDWLVYQDKRVAPLIEALQDDALRLASDAACLAELVDVLSREQIRATPEQRQTALETYRQTAQMIEALPAPACPPGTPPALSPAALPQCRDQDDQKFIELAVRCGAKLLVSRDRELLRMHHRLLLIASLAVVEPVDALGHL